MICPHCSVAVKIDWNYTRVIEKDLETNKGKLIQYDKCPNCEKGIVFYSIVGIEMTDFGNQPITDQFDNYIIESKKLIYPNKTQFEDSELIPNKYFSDYIEAVKVISISPKASAALTRRLLQKILHNEFKIKKRNLSEEIEEFISQPGMPSHITSAIDAVRNIGNFAAHPIKNKNTGEIVDVEPGEADWLLQVIETLFDFTFIQPKKIENRRRQLNDKLEELGKPLLK